MYNRKDYAERAARNDESRTTADHHAEPWSGDEDDFLKAEWDNTDATLAVIAELLGRTIEACRQRYYIVQRGHVRTETTITVTQKRWLVGFCFKCGHFTDVFTDGKVALCDDCRN